ncbi:P-loop NTPase fold protein, partial [Salmonella enterica]|uniref:P-loop NTPase fold protein n=1 Tax=Salmonella enterica TaxID=28901 RepID=UPI003CEB1BF0
KKVKEEIFFIEDGTYGDGEIDNEKILEKLITTLQNFKPEAAFSIGINAVWGYGKSSFLEKFRKDYKEVQPRTIIFWNRI